MSVGGMIFRGCLVIANIFSSNPLNHSETLIEKPQYSGQFLSRTQSLGTVSNVRAKFTSF